MAHAEKRYIILFIINGLLIHRDVAKRRQGRNCMKLRNCNAENFISELEGRKAICFGAGSTLIESDFWESKIEKLEEHIAFFIDNDIKKHGNKFKFHGHEFDIKGVDAFQLIDKSKYVILITCLYIST